MRADISRQQPFSSLRTWNRAGRVALLLVVCAATPDLHAQWTQWGGPRQSFCCDSTGLAEKWPADGPRKLWSSEISGGHSAIVVEGDTLYTMCRRDGKDAVLALNANTGEKVWETQYDAPTKPDMQLEFGEGPHSTPLVVGDRVFTAGAMGHCHALDKKTGKILWSHNLMDEFEAGHLGRGYGASPMPYRDLVIVNAGGRAEDAPGVLAFRQDTGELAWKSEHLTGGYPSPILAKINGEDHLIIAQRAARVGLDPATGAVKWRTEVDIQSAAIMATPVWIAPDRVFFSAAYGGGSRLLRIDAKDGEYSAEELWHSRKMKVHHASIVQIGDYVYASSGDFGPAFLMALDLSTGKVAWRERGFAKANLLYADGKLIILDERGMLALATATPEGLEVHSQVKLLEEKSWTAPTLVGTRLYLRDYNTIMALDVSAAGNG